MKGTMKRIGFGIGLLLLVCLMVGCSNEEKINELIQQGDTAYNEGKFTEAVDVYTQILELDDTKDEIYNNRGMAYMKQKQYIKAANDFTQAIELDNTVDVYYNNRGLAKYYDAALDDAIADFTLAIEMNGSDANYYSNRGDAYTGKVEYEKAVQDYNKALELDPERVVTFNNRASAYFNMGLFEEAVADYTVALEKEPENSVVYWNRGEAYRMLGKYEEAVADYDMYEQTAELGLGGEFCIKRAEANVALENFEAALDDYTLAIEGNKSDKTLYLGRANISYEMENYKDAISDYDFYLMDYNDPIALGNRGYCHYMLGNIDKALEDLNTCIELKEDYAWAYFTRGQIYQEQEKFEEAKADYEKANTLMDSAEAAE